MIQSIPLHSIGLFNDSYPPIMDGVAVTVYNYAFWLNKKNQDVTVVAPKAPNFQDKEDFEVMRYASVPIPQRKPYRLGLPYMDIQFLNNLYAKKDFHLVHAHSPFVAGRLATKIARKRKIPIVGTFHSKYKDDFKRALSLDFAANQITNMIIHFFEQLDEVWIPQASVEETIREYGFKGNVQVVNNGTDFKTNNAIEPIKSSARETLNIPQDEFVFLFVGQHIWEKNTKLIIDALGLLQETDFKMFFIGDGYAAERMKEMVKEKNLESKIIFKGIILERQILKKYYVAADLFLFPSLYDNAPLVVREAAALHTPSIIVKNSTASEVVVDNVNGYLTDNTPVALAEKIKYAISNRANLKLIAENASKTIAQSWEEIVEEVLDRYVHLINRK